MNQTDSPANRDPASYRLSPAEPADAAAIAELHRSSGMPVEGAVAGSGQVGNLGINPGSGPGEHNVLCLIARREPDGAPAGFIRLRLVGTDAVLEALMFGPADRGKGLAALLLGEALRQLVRSGVQSVTLLAGVQAGYFKRFGFVTTPASSLPAAVAGWVAAMVAGEGVDLATAMRGEPGPGLPLYLDLRSATLVSAAVLDDMAAVVGIYNDAVAQSTATYDYEPRSLDDQQALFLQKQRDGHGFFVAKTPDGTVAGFSTYGPFRTRPGWRFASEHSVYVAAPWRGMRVGLSLLPPVMQHARGQGFHTMVGVVDASNEASLRMHARAGFTPIGTFREGGYKFERWLDVTFVQAML